MSGIRRSAGLAVAMLLVLGATWVVVGRRGRAPALPVPRLVGPGPGDPFAARLFSAATQAAPPEDNVVISPLGVRLALSLAAAGARGETYAALGRVLDDSATDVATRSRRDSSLLAVLAKQDDVTLETANALWVAPPASIVPPFAAHAARAYRARIASVALAEQRGIDDVNAWVRESTHGKITQLLDAPQPPSIAMLITNAIYFKGDWLVAFDRDATSPMSFRVSPSKTMTVPGMSRTASVAYQRATEFQAIRLPYRGDRMALHVILPDSGVAVDDVVTRIARDGWRLVAAAYAEREVAIRLPRIHAEGTVDFKAPLASLGAGIIFDCDRADFSGLVTVPERPRSCVSGVTQKVFLDVDEKGSEAAAATMMEIRADSASALPVRFTVDRPFLIVLRDDVSGALLFVGRIARPAT